MQSVGGVNAELIMVDTEELFLAGWVESDDVIQIWAYGGDFDAAGQLGYVESTPTIIYELTNFDCETAEEFVYSQTLMNIHELSHVCNGDEPPYDNDGHSVDWELFLLKTGVINLP